MHSSQTVTDGWFYTEDDNQVLLRKYIVRNMKDTPCEVCDDDLHTHEWVELGALGAVVKCNKRTDDLPKRYEFENYVAYNSYGGVDVRVSRIELDAMVKEFKETGKLGNGCWEFLIDADGSILARVAPNCRLDGKDNGWRSWEHTFVEERL